MTRQISVGEIVSLRPGHGRVDDLLDAVLPARAEHALPATDTGADLGNVVPFVRPRGGARTAPEVVLPSDAARPGYGQPRRVSVCALRRSQRFRSRIHGALFAAFWREPAPLASIGMEVISVAIVVGATAPAGVATTQGEQQINSAAAPETERPRPTTRGAGDRAAAEGSGRARRKGPRAEDQAEAAGANRRSRSSKPPPRRRSPRRSSRSPRSRWLKGQSPKRRPPSRKTFRRRPTEVTLLPQPEEKPAEMKPAPKPVQAAPPKPVKDAKPAKEPPPHRSPTREQAAREANASTPSTAANNIGVGRSDRDTNYPGLVSAHLRRHQQYPADARSRGDQGTATVSFSLDGGGRVTRPASRAAPELPASIRRCRLWCAARPISGTARRPARSFTVPVAFRLN